MNELTFEQLKATLTAVFALREREDWLTIMVDLPDGAPDTPEWRDRRAIAGEWFETLQRNAGELPFSAVVFCAYPNVGSNNNDLPESARVARDLDAHARLPEGEAMPLDQVLASSSVVLALTEFSATAPLKLLGREHGFCGATMPGFMRAMVPVLALDFEEVNARVVEFKERMDRAVGVAVTMIADGTEHESHFDLRFRTGHASGGLMREPGMVGNLPSGEAYVVPYEGENAGEPSRTAGELPVQLGDEVVVYRLENNRAVEVLSSGPVSEEERQRLRDEPAYGNMAEVGIGVLGQWGIEAVGSTLLDEKLGLHIAFGRSDHFGGVTSPDSFNDRSNVVHIDRVYVESVQPRIRLVDVAFVYPDGQRETIIRDGAFVV
ncbi:MAG: hypothetical protein ACOCUW_05585 [Gemmatimonadota bacterium]